MKYRFLEQALPIAAIAVASLLMFSNLTYAEGDCPTNGYVGQGGTPNSPNQKITRIITGSGEGFFPTPETAAWAFFGVSPTDAVATFCNFFGSLHFRFDSSTPQGKAMLSTLLYAKAAGKNVDVWFCSSSPSQNDCDTDLSHIAIATAISVRD